VLPAPINLRTTPRAAHHGLAGRLGVLLAPIAPLAVAAGALSGRKITDSAHSRADFARERAEPLIMA
jgi:hypothetical protein